MKPSILLAKLDARIQALPGSDQTKQTIVDAIIYGVGATIGLACATVIYKAGQKSVR